MSIKGLNSQANACSSKLGDVPKGGEFTSDAGFKKGKQQIKKRKKANSSTQRSNQKDKLLKNNENINFNLAKSVNDYKRLSGGYKSSGFDASSYNIITSNVSENCTRKGDIKAKFPSQNVREQLFKRAQEMEKINISALSSKNTKAHLKDSSNQEAIDGKQPYICPITGKPATNLHPTTGLPFANKEAYRVIDEIVNCDHRLDTFIGVWYSTTKVD
ncbi:hypothetical protein H4219_001461 [Mycoemilia scoparia]|uniref:Vps72/YL1 C-terminal domain-containing protein n=1 Tax=Mycoemilia scoparia TaxID=417184 RepID=A0A9W8DRU2_9FUNG|nr:hypothetical protein H4219_001461 [Mycoemilia scoparia]